MTSIGNNAFDGSSYLTSVTVFATTPCTLGTDAFSNCASGLKIYVFNDLVGTYQTNWSEYSTKIMAFPSGNCGATDFESDVKWVYDEGTKTITIMKIGNTGAMADYSGDQPWNSYCTSINSVVIEDGVTTIGDQVFSGCSGLTLITIPNSVTSIGSEAFGGCSNLTTITLYSNPIIGTNAFPASTTVTMNLTANAVGDANWMTFYNHNYSFEADASTTVYKGITNGSSVSLKGCRRRRHPEIDGQPPCDDTHYGSQRRYEQQRPEGRG